MKFVEDLSKDSEEKAIHDLEEMYSKFPKRFKQLESEFKKYYEKGDIKRLFIPRIDRFRKSTVLIATRAEVY